MNNKKCVLFAVLAVLLSLVMTVSGFTGMIFANAEGEEPGGQGGNSAETTTAAQNSTTAAQADPTTEKTTSNNVFDPTESTTHKVDSSEQDTHVNTSETNANPSDPNSSTTKNNGSGNKTTTKKYVPTTQGTTAPRMTVPEVENTTTEGEVMDPMSAYFERISGDEETEVLTMESTTEAAEEEDGGTHLSTPAIIAICVAVIALLTGGITGIFVLRNKRGAKSEDEYDDDNNDDGYDDGGDYGNGGYNNGGGYSGANEYNYSATPQYPVQDVPPMQVNESNNFTVVDYNDNDFFTNL